MKLACAIVLVGGAASAAPFPPDSQYVPLHCNKRVMFDAQADDPAALGPRDVVGNDTGPAGLRASDAQNLYLRIRVDKDPTTAPYSWGMEFDLDGDRTTYELLILADATAAPAQVAVFTNKTTTIANSPTDPADTPAVMTYTFANNERFIATSTTFGSDPDYFVDIAVPWSVLTPLGLDRNTPTYVWVASSSAPDALNGDFACSSDGGGTAPPLDSGAASDPTTGDPAQDPTANGSLRLEGGSGCNAGGRGSNGFALVLIAAFAWVRRRARR